MRHLDLIGWPLEEALEFVQRDCPDLIVRVVGCDPLKSFAPPIAVKRVVRQRWGDDSLELTVSVFQDIER